MRKVTVYVTTVLAFLTTFAVAAHASGGGSVGLDTALSDLAKLVVDGFKSGAYGEAAVLSVLLAVAALRKFGGMLHPKLASGAAATVYVLVGTFAAGLAVNGLSWSAAWDAVKMAGAAAGGYSLVEQLARLLLKWEKLPGWARKLVELGAWIFKPRGEAEIKKAEAAGDKAVAENPGKGLGPVDRLP